MHSNLPSSGNFDESLGEWGVGSRESGVGSGEYQALKELFTPHPSLSHSSPLTPHFLTLHPSPLTLSPSQCLRLNKDSTEPLPLVAK